MTLQTSPIHRRDSHSPPPAAAAQVFIDFDGTLTTCDVLDQLIINFSINDRWKELEKLWQLKEIGSRQCLSEELAQVRISPADLRKFLSNIPLDPGAINLLAFLKQHHIPVTVLSDGLDFFIETILARHAISGLEVRCNKMSHERDRISLGFPFEEAHCESAAAHCKCASARTKQQANRNSVYIGDGRSDLCAARRADFVFAKGELARCLEIERIAFQRFETLNDVRLFLQKHWNPDRGG